MLFIILTVVAFVDGFVFWELIDEIYLPICLFLGIFRRYRLIYVWYAADG